ncbi:hypothetical protein ACFL02_06960 [Planctomycetota bacterium]
MNRRIILPGAAVVLGDLVVPPIAGEAVGVFYRGGAALVVKERAEGVVGLEPLKKLPSTAVGCKGRRRRPRAKKSSPTRLQGCLRAFWPCVLADDLFARPRNKVSFVRDS